MGMPVDKRTQVWTWRFPNLYADPQIDNYKDKKQVWLNIVRKTVRWVQGDESKLRSLEQFPRSRADVTHKQIFEKLNYIYAEILRSDWFLV